MLPSDQVNRNYIWESSAEYNAWKVEFPKNPNFELMLVGAELRQSVEEHEILFLHFKGKPYVDNSTLVSGDLVKFTYTTDKVPTLFYGYIDSIDTEDTIDMNNTNVLCVGSSYLLKNTNQRILKNVTADQVVSKIAKENGMTAVTQRHPRVRKSIVQAGQSDWQLLRRLAKQTGFALRVENTTIIFVSKNKIYNKRKSSAPYFRYVDSKSGITTKANRSSGTLLEFTLSTSDDSPETGARIDRVITGLNENTGTVIETTHKLKEFISSEIGVVVPEETSAAYLKWEALNGQ